MDKDLAKAAELYRKGADLGNREAQNNLGTFLMNGMGVPQDRKQAFHLFKDSAKQGYGVAMRNLGNCYQYAYGTDGNMRKAVEWYEKALEQLDDPELEQKVKIFREMGDSDPEWDSDYPEEEEIEQEAEALNGPLKAALKAQGMPTDEEYINSLPAEEVFALLASLENGGKYIPPVKEPAEPVNEPEQPAGVTEEAAIEPEPAAPVSEPEFFREPEQEAAAPAEEPEPAAEPEPQPEPAVFEEPAEPVRPAADYLKQDEDKLLDEIFAMPDFAEGRDMAKIFEAIDRPAVKEEAEPEPQEPETVPAEAEAQPAETPDAEEIPSVNEPEPATEPEPQPEPAAFEEPVNEPEQPAELPPLEDLIGEEDIEEASEAPVTENLEPAIPEAEEETIDETAFPFTEAPVQEPEPEPEPDTSDETVVAEAKYVIEEIRSPKETR